MRRVGQLQAAKVSGMSGKSITFKDFPRQAGLDAQELPGEHRLHKDVRRIGQLQASMFLSNDEMHYKSVFRRFLVFVIFCGTIMRRLNE